MAIDKAVDSSWLNSLFTGIANAIRGKNGTSDQYSPDQMPAAIQAIQTGVDTSDATATAYHLLAGQTAYVKGEKITGQIQRQAAQTITPGTANKTISPGVYLGGTQTIKGDSNLVAANIKSGVSIFGVTGTLGAVQSASGAFSAPGTHSEYVTIEFDFVPDAIEFWHVDEETSGSYKYGAGFFFTRGRAQTSYVSFGPKKYYNFSVFSYSNSKKIFVYAEGPLGNLDESENVNNTFLYIAYKFS